MSKKDVAQIDRRQLQQIVAGLSEGIVIIDPNGALVWANETALEAHGVTELAELGVNAKAYRKNFVLKYRDNRLLASRHYPIDRLLRGEMIRDLIVQVTRSDDEDDFHRVHQLRGFALTDAADEHESLVLAIVDISEQISAEERFERAFNANPAPALICRISDLRYVKVNQGFVDMTGYSAQTVLGHSVYEIDVLADAQDREAAIAHLQRGETIQQREATLALPDGASKFVIVAGQPLEVADENCMLFTFIDLEARKQAEIAMRRSEELFSKAFRLAPVPMIVASSDDLRVLEVNEVFTTVSGYTSEEILGRDLNEFELWANRKAFQTLKAMLAEQGGVRSHEIQLSSKQRAPIDCLVSVDTVSIHGQPCVLFVIQDITERKRSEVELVAALEAVMRDTSWFSRSVIEKLAQFRQPAGERRGSDVADLTPREREVLGLMCQGSDDAKMAADLGLSRNTVRNHVATLYAKLGVNRRSAAIVWGRERGIIGYEKPLKRKARRAKV